MKRSISTQAAAVLAVSLASAPVALGMLASGCADARAASPGAAATELPRVRAVPIDRAAVVRRVRAEGTLHAKSEVDLAFKVGGVLANVRVDRGARVRRGQVLASLDATEYGAGLRQAREQARRADRELARATRLSADGAIATSVLEDATTAQASAAAAETAARFNVERTTLVAPVDGWIEARAAEPGEIVSPGRPVLRMSGVDRGWVVRAPLVDRDAVRVRPGDRAEVAIDALPGAPLAATVTEVAPAATPGTGTYEIEVRLDAAPEAALLSGLSAKVSLPRAEPGLVAVPSEALLDASGHDARVVALTGDVARRVPVRVAYLDGEHAVVAADLARYDAIVTAGAAALADGAKVRVDAREEASR